MGNILGNPIVRETWATDIKIAKELLYPNEVIEALKLEPDHKKRMLILTNARKQEIRKELNNHGKINRKHGTNNKNKRLYR